MNTTYTSTKKKLPYFQHVRVSNINHANQVLQVLMSGCFSFPAARTKPYAILLEICKTTGRGGPRTFVRDNVSNRFRQPAVGNDIKKSESPVSFIQILRKYPQ